jgi:toxin-antitoxin system PIN domain toxin
VRALLDVNVLLALFDPEHVHHAAASAWRLTNRDEGWASCPLTQNGFIRVISGPRYPRLLALSVALRLLRAQVVQPEHAFWPDDVSLIDADAVDHGRIVGPNQITDVYLLALAMKNAGRLVTFDRSVPLAAVRGAEPRHLVVLTASVP